MVFFFGRFFLNEFYPESFSMINFIGSQNAFRFSPLRCVRHESENPCNDTQNLPEVKLFSFITIVCNFCTVTLCSSLTSLVFFRVISVGQLFSSANHVGPVHHVEFLSCWIFAPRLPMSAGFWVVGQFRQINSFCCIFATRLDTNCFHSQSL